MVVIFLLSRSFWGKPSLKRDMGFSGSSQWTKTKKMFPNTKDNLHCNDFGCFKLSLRKTCSGLNPFSWTVERFHVFIGCYVWERIWCPRRSLTKNLWKLERQNLVGAANQRGKRIQTPVKSIRMIVKRLLIPSVLTVWYKLKHCPQCDHKHLNEKDRETVVRE